jgi:Sugar phosphate isomerases/epimerases
MAFELTGFADEIDANFQTQLTGLNSLGIRHIEVRGVNGKNISKLTSQEVHEMRKQLVENGIRVSSIGSPIGKISITSDFKEHMEMVQRIFHTANELESPYIRIFSFYMPEGQAPSAYKNEVIDRLGTILEAAKDSGITVLHENEKDIYGDLPERCLDLMDSLRGYRFASAFDPANFVQCGAESFPQAFDLLRPYIQYVHIKDALATGQNVPPGHGAGGIEQILKALKEDGYDGFLSLEPHLGNSEGFAELEKDLLPGAIGTSQFAKFKLAHDSLAIILKSI